MGDDALDAFLKWPVYSLVFLKTDQGKLYGILPYVAAGVAVYYFRDSRGLPLALALGYAAGGATFVLEMKYLASTQK